MGQVHGEIAAGERAQIAARERVAGDRESLARSVAGDRTSLARGGLRAIARLSLVCGWRFARRRGMRRVARWGLAAWWSPLLRWGLLWGWRLLARRRRNAHVVRHDATVASRSVRRGAIVGIAVAFLTLSAAASASAQTASPAWELTSVHGPTNVPLTPSVNEVYKLTVRGSSGKYSLTFENQETGEFGTTKLIPFGASALEVQEALEKLKEGEHKAIGEGNVNVTGGPGDEHGTKPYLIEFVGALGGRDLGTEALTIEETTLSEAEEERCEAEGAECEPEVTLATPGSRDIVDYQVIPRNTGGAAAKPPAPGQPITIRDNLPAGLTTQATAEGNDWSCAVAESKAEEKRRKEAKLPEGAGRAQIQCTSEATVNPDSQAEPIAFQAVVRHERRQRRLDARKRCQHQRRRRSDGRYRRSRAGQRYARSVRHPRLHGRHVQRQRRNLHAGRGAPVRGDHELLLQHRADLRQGRTGDAAGSARQRQGRRCQAARRVHRQPAGRQALLAGRIHLRPAGRSRAGSRRLPGRIPGRLSRRLLSRLRGRTAEGGGLQPAAACRRTG